MRLRDPEGVAVHVHHGFTPSEALPVRPQILHNAPGQTVRVNDTQRPKLEPPQVTKLGHLVLETPNFEPQRALVHRHVRVHPVGCDVPR